jgi:chemotaxis protein MotB
MQPAADRHGTEPAPAPGDIGSAASEAAPGSDAAAAADATEPEPESSGRLELQAELDQAVWSETVDARAPSVAVEETGGGYLISLTDDADFGMFDVGSAEPQPEMVRIMERIAAILRARNGSVVIRGHTDARPYRSGNYDNWRLSTDRAQMAYYMLVRGGLDEHRVAGIEGYADRQLKVPSDPDAAENRRIEIFLRERGT